MKIKTCNNGASEIILEVYMKWANIIIEMIICATIGIIYGKTIDRKYGKIWGSIAGAAVGIVVGIIQY